MLCVSSRKEAEKDKELSHASVPRASVITISPRDGEQAQTPVGWGSHSCVGRWGWNRAGWEGGLQASSSSGLHLLLSSQGQPKGSSPFLLLQGSKPPDPGTLREEEFASFPRPLVPALGRWQEVRLLTSRSQALCPFLSKCLPPWAPWARRARGKTFQG